MCNSEILNHIGKEWNMQNAFRGTNRIRKELKLLWNENQNCVFLNEILINKDLINEFIKSLCIFTIFSISEWDEDIINIKIQNIDFDLFLSKFIYNFFENFDVEWLLLAINDLKLWNNNSDDIMFTQRSNISKMFNESKCSTGNKQNFEWLNKIFEDSISVINNHFIEKWKEEFIIQINEILEK